MVTTYHTASLSNPSVPCCNSNRTDAEEVEVPLQLLLVTRGIDFFGSVILRDRCFHTFDLLRRRYFGILHYDLRTKLRERETVQTLASNGAIFTRNGEKETAREVIG